jgi:CHAT domain-containing protein/Tfp pilus assembly protein PilF
MMRSAVLLLCLLVVPGALGVGGAQDDPRAARVAEAAALIARRAAADALKILEPLLADPALPQDEALMATALRQTGAAWFQLNEYVKARDAYDRALPISRRLPTRTTEAAVTFGIAQVLKNQGAYPAALERAGAAMALYTAAGDVQGQARSHVLTGSIHDLMGDHRDALASYQTAVPMFDEANQRTALLVQNEMGITLKNLGLYQDALDHYARALDGQTKAGDLYGQGVTLLNTGVAYSLLGQDDRALGAFERALALAKQVGDRRGQTIAVGNLGDLLFDRGDDRRALQYFEQQLALTRELGNRNEEANAHTSIGDVLSWRGDAAGARDHYNTALAIQRQIGARRREGMTLQALAVTALQQNAAGEADGFARQALALAQSTDSPDLEWRARLSLARAARARHRVNQTGLDQTIDELRASARIVNDLRANVASDAGKIGFLDARQDVFRELASTLVEAGRPADALEAAEAGRARAFADLLEQRSVTGKPANVAGLAAVRSAIDAARTAAAPASVPASVPTPALDGRGGAGRTRAATLDESLARLSAADGELASLLTADSPTRTEIAGIVARLNATLVEYLVTDRELLAWVVSPDGAIHATAIATGRKQIERLTENIRRAIAAVDAAALRQPRGLSSQLRDFDRLLIAPLRPWLPAAPDALVVIVPNGPLAVLPFAAFEDARGQPLAARHTLAFAPSISVYRYTAAKRAAAGDAMRALVIADPAPPPGSGVEALPGAREEGRLVTGRLGARGVTLLSGAAASESAVKRLAGAQRILHFATHGLVSAERPLASSLLLAAGDGEDGYLRVDEIFALPLAADLVVLSGCSTGMGRLSGDGIVGLSRAFIYAGTPAVLVSQWDVDDRATAFLMDRFYRDLRLGRGTAAALRSAQLETRRRFPHPAMWAGFVLTGEPR